MNNPDKISTNIDDYTYAELLVILDLDDNEATDVDAIEEKTDKYIARFEKEGNKKMSVFFGKIKKRLVANAQEIEDGESVEDEQTKKWIQNAGALEQPSETQRDKITDRFQQIDVYGNPYVPMEQQQLGVNNVHNVDVAQDGKLNPTLQNTTTRMVVLDSFFRQESAGGNISTDYTLDLSDRLTNVLSMRLWSLQIPNTFYVIDEVYGNTCFWITNGAKSVSIAVPPGNYTPAQLVVALSASFQNAGFTFSDPPVVYNESNYKITLQLINGFFIPPVGSSDPGFTITTDTIITFFDADTPLVCTDTCIPQALHINETLGWVMGFHSQTGKYNVDANGNTAESVIDLTGPRYFILVVDDFTQNHLNDGLVTITEPSKLVRMPSYYTTDNPVECVDNSGNVIPQLVQTSPRTLTQSQLYTINEIMKNNVYNMDTRAKAPTTTNVLAIIPVKNQTKGALYVDFSGQLQENRRTYFGPVDIERMRVRLLDDKGNTLNLNGGNWSFTMLCEILYQY